MAVAQGSRPSRKKARQEVLARLSSLHAGEETIYSGCRINCGGSQCVLKVRRKNGVVTAIEPDDHYNPGVGREDAVLTDSDLQKNRLQLRGCPMAWMWHKLANSPDRILYPLKRVEGTPRGGGQFERISWDEALDLVANKMKEAVEKYGPHTVMTPYAPNSRIERLFGLWGAGVEGWGWCSFDPERLAMHLMAGEPGWFYSEGSNDNADILLNTKMIVLWGFEPTITHFGPGHQLAYFLKMARERGVPIVCIDPRYTTAAEVLADQWIPIKPGTDSAMMLAVAYVLFEEDLYNKEYVDRYVDRHGFDIWRAYVEGKEDGVAKSPEWAERICAVPAETIRGFARLYASNKPTWLWKGWAVARKSRGENTARAAGALQAIMGYWGVAGGSVPFFTSFRNKPPVMMPYGDVPRYPVPKMYRSHKWTQVVLLLAKVQAGELSVDEYKRIVGYRADVSGESGPEEWDFLAASTLGHAESLQVDATDGAIGSVPGHTEAGGRGSGARSKGTKAGGPESSLSTRHSRRPQDLSTSLAGLPNPKILLWGAGNHGPGTNILNNNADSTNDQLRALDKLELVVWAGTQMCPAAEYADLVLPIEDETLEGRRIEQAQYGGFANFTFIPGVVEPLGESKCDDWVYSELARRLGVGDAFNWYYDGSNWDEAWESYLQNEYERCAEKLKEDGVAAPTWDEFTKTALINVEESYDKPWHGYRRFIEDGEPLKTKSGKIELWSDIMADESQRGKVHYDAHGRLIGFLPNDWRDLPPIPAYQQMYRGMDHADVKRFPLMLISSYSRYRNHSTFWNVPWLRGDAYRHAVWMSAADAAARGIRDGELARITNDRGTAVMPAYVTQRILPGMIVLHHGGWYRPDENGVDWGATPNVFLGDSESPVTASHVTTLVQIEKYEGPAPSRP